MKIHNAAASVVTPGGLVDIGSMKVTNTETMRLPAHSARIMCAMLTEYGIDPEPLLHKSGISQDVVSVPDGTVLGQQEIAFQRAFSDATRDLPGAWFRTGRRYRALSYGSYGLAVLCSDTFGESLRLCVNSLQDLNYSLLSYDLIEEDGEICGLSSTDENVPDDLKDFCRERALGSVLTLLSDILSRPMRFDRIESALPACPNWLRDDQQAGGPVTFGASATCWYFDRALTNEPLPFANPTLSQTYRQLCDQLIARYSADAGFVSRVYAILIKAGPDVPSFPSVASELAVSERTLHRKLSQVNLTYMTLVAQVREERSRNLLRQTNKPISEIAYMLGYREVASFSHAFKRWTGLSPIEFRNQR